MAAPEFTPVFGPNGAVLNAPSMTPEMREKLARASRLPTTAEFLRGLSSFGLIALFAAVASLNNGALHDLLKSSTWTSGFTAGAIAMLTAVVISISVRRAFARWELPCVRGRQRKLQLPEWGRWLLASTDSLALAGYGVFVAAMIIDVQRQYWLFWFAGGLAAGCIAAIGFGLRWVATQRGWKLRADPA